MNNFFIKFKKQYNLSTQIIIVVAIVAVLNFLSYQLFARLDLTQGKIYSISSVSKEAVRNLDDVVNIKVYFSANLPAQYLSVRQEVKDILAEYQNYGGNKLRVEYIDPKDNQELQQELQMLGIPQLQFNVLENDKYEVTSGYLGMSVQYGDSRQAIPVVNSTENLEYQLTSALKKVTTKEFPSLGFATGNGEHSRTTDMTSVDKKLREIYSVRDIDLSTGTEIPTDINTLLIAGPTQAFSERELYDIDQFVMRGGSIIFLVDGVSVDDALQATPNEAALTKILNAYGVNVENAFVLDTQNDRASFSQGFFTFTTDYPFFVRVTPSGFAQDNAAVAKLQNVVLPWVSPLTIQDNAKQDVSVLAHTTPAAWLMRDNFNLNPQGDFGFTQDPNNYNVAVARIGQISSAFSAYVPQDNENGTHLPSTDNGKIIIVGNSKFATDSFVNRYADNQTLLQNLVDFVSLDSDLINIRSKAITDRPLEIISDAHKNSLKYFNIFGITALVLVFGLVRYYMRKRSRFADEL
jgi:gliding-associated putative ABC transporter substrate-binding component GldG